MKSKKIIKLKRVMEKHKPLELFSLVRLLRNCTEDMIDFYEESILTEYKEHMVDYHLYAESCNQIRHINGNKPIKVARYPFDFVKEFDRACV